MSVNRRTDRPLDHRLRRRPPPGRHGPPGHSGRRSAVRTQARHHGRRPPTGGPHTLHARARGGTAGRPSRRAYVRRRRDRVGRGTTAVAVEHCRVRSPPVGSTAASTTRRPSMATRPPDGTVTRSPARRRRCAVPLPHRGGQRDRPRRRSTGGVGPCRASTPSRAPSATERNRDAFMRIGDAAGPPPRSLPPLPAHPRRRTGALMAVSRSPQPICDPRDCPAGHPTSCPRRRTARDRTPFVTHTPRRCEPC
jgi:hypothetical protein